jgi:DNA-binding CsgD family transcriptional regulator
MSDETIRTALAPLEEIAARHGIDPDTLRAAVEHGEIRPHRQPGDSRTILAERDVLIWMAGRNDPGFS